MAQPVDHPRFIAMLAERFPEIAASIDECSQGLLHMEIATLARATQAAIDAQDEPTVVRHFRFIDEVLRDASPDVENAVKVSYLENLRFKGKAASRRARELLAPRLRQALAELEQYLERIFGGLNKGPDSHPKRSERLRPDKWPESRG